MKDTTKQLIAIAFGQDDSISDDLKNAVVAILEGKQNIAQTEREPLDRVLSRLQVAAIFGCKPENVDYYGRMGYIRRVSITGRDAQGYSEQSVREALKRTSTLRATPRNTQAAREAQRRKREKSAM